MGFVLYVDNFKNSKYELALWPKIIIKLALTLMLTLALKLVLTLVLICGFCVDSNQHYSTLPNDSVNTSANTIPGNYQTTMVTTPHHTMGGLPPYPAQSSCPPSVTHGSQQLQQEPGGGKKDKDPGGDGGAAP